MGSSSVAVSSSDNHAGRGRVILAPRSRRNLSEMEPREATSGNAKQAGDHP